MKNPTPAQQLVAFLARYTPEIAALARAALAKMRKRLPGAVELVYDNYNAFVIAFGPTESVSDAIFSIAVYPRWINLFFARGASLPDPQGLLQGSGTRVRHIVLESALRLDAPAVGALIAAALKRAPKAIDPTGRRRMVIRVISAKQRPRRPRG